MEIQASNQTIVSATLANPEVESAREDTNETGSERAESNTKSSPDPAVVTSISSSTLAASRAESTANATEAQAQTNAVIVADTREQGTKANEQIATTGNQTLQTSRVDTIV